MAQLKHIFRGESLTVLLTFPEAYDMARIEKHEIYIGTTAFTGVVSGQTIELKLTSEQTDEMYGKQEIRLWLDDSVLGVKKPYCGDIIVSNSNAKPANDSTSSISDIIIPIVISETAVTVGDVLYNYVKGEKGKPFLYSDFTPEQIEALKVKGDAFEYSDFTSEQIALLQKPASDIATTVSNAEGFRVTAETNRNNAEGLRLSAEITRNENEADRIEAEGLRAGAETGRQTAEGLRQQAELNRQTNTSTAILNAEQATDDANNAAILANEKAGLAATAATQANTARDGANSAAESATNLVNSYATDLAAKANKTQEGWIVPTLNAPWEVNMGNTIAYMKDEFGFVHVKGNAIGGGAGSWIFQFPIGYGSNNTRYFVCNSDGFRISYLYINWERKLILSSGETTGLSLDGIIFKAE